MKKVIVIVVLIVLLVSPLYAIGRRKIVKLYPTNFRIDDYVVRSAVETLIEKINEMINEIEAVKDRIEWLELSLKKSKYK